MSQPKIGSISSKDRITWEELMVDIDILIEKIREYQPHMIIGFMRAGLIPAVLIAEKLGNQAVFSIGVERRGDERRIVHDIQESLEGLRVLLVEDALPTGKGPMMVKRTFLKRGAADVRIAAVYATPQAATVTDYYTKVLNPLPHLPWKPSRIGDKIISRSLK